MNKIILTQQNKFYDQKKLNKKILFNSKIYLNKN